MSFADSLVGYGIVDDEFDAEKLLKYVVEEYVAEATRPPPPWASLKSTECEICERSDMHLTYHHLIPVRISFGLFIRLLGRVNKLMTPLIPYSRNRCIQKSSRGVGILNTCSTV